MPIHTAGGELAKRTTPAGPDLPSSTSDTPMATLAALPTSNTDPYAARERHHNEGHGRRLTAAFEALEAFPVLAESRNRVLRLFEGGEPSASAIVQAVEGDVAMAIAVLRLANQLDGPSHGRVDSAVSGV